MTVPARALAVVFATLGACGFFKELEGVGDDSESSDGAAGETGAGAGTCEPGMDRCEGQDLLHSCDVSTGETTAYDCAGLCGSNLNFTCLAGATGQHGCWCVVPGDQKIDACPDLEACLAHCVSDESCADRCFGRTTSDTIRLYGSLLSCAEATCFDICGEAPAACGDCLLAARDGLYGDCGVQRSVCDSDRADDGFPWP